MFDFDSDTIKHIVEVAEEEINKAQNGSDDIVISKEVLDKYINIFTFGLKLPCEEMATKTKCTRFLIYLLKLIIGHNCTKLLVFKSSLMDKLHYTKELYLRLLNIFVPINNDSDILLAQERNCVNFFKLIIPFISELDTYNIFYSREFLMFTLDHSLLLTTNLLCVNTNYHSYKAKNTILNYLSPSLHSFLYYTWTQISLIDFPSYLYWNRFNAVFLMSIDNTESLIEWAKISIFIIKVLFGVILNHQKEEKFSTKQYSTYVQLFFRYLFLVKDPCVFFDPMLYVRNNMLIVKKFGIVNKYTSLDQQYSSMNSGIVNGYINVISSLLPQSFNYFIMIIEVIFNEIYFKSRNYETDNDYENIFNSKSMIGMSQPLSTELNSDLDVKISGSTKKNLDLSPAPPPIPSTLSKFPEKKAALNTYNTISIFNMLPEKVKGFRNSKLYKSEALPHRPSSTQHTLDNDSIPARKCINLFDYEINGINVSELIFNTDSSMQSKQFIKAHSVISVLIPWLSQCLMPHLSSESEILEIFNLIYSDLCKIMNFPVEFDKPVAFHTFVNKTYSILDHHEVVSDLTILKSIKIYSEYELGKSIIIKMLSVLLSDFNTSHLIPLPHLIHIYSLVNFNLSYRFTNGKALVGKFFNCSADLFLNELQFGYMLVPNILCAINFIITSSDFIKDKEFKYANVKETPSVSSNQYKKLVAAALKSLISNLNFAFHYYSCSFNDEIKVVTKGEVGNINYGLIMMIVRMLVYLLTKDSWNDINVMVFSALQNMFWNLVSFDKHSKDMNISEENKVVLPRDMFKSVLHISCGLLLNISNNKNANLDSILHLLNFISSFAIVEMDFVDKTTCKLLIEKICLFIKAQATLPPVYHNKTLHSTIIAALLCLQRWLLYQKWLFDYKEVMVNVFAVIELGLFGPSDFDTDSLIEEHRINPISFRVANFTATLLYNISRYICEPYWINPLSIYESLDETKLKKKIETEEVVSVDYFIYMKSIFLSFVKFPVSHCKYGELSGPALYRPKCNLVARSNFGKTIIEAEMIPVHDDKYDAFSASMKSYKIDCSELQDYQFESSKSQSNLNFEGKIALGMVFEKPTYDKLKTKSSFIKAIENYQKKESDYNTMALDSLKNNILNQKQPPEIKTKFDVSRLFYTQFCFFNLSDHSFCSVDSSESQSSIDKDRNREFEKIDSLENHSTLVDDFEHFDSSVSLQSEVIAVFYMTGNLSQLDYSESFNEFVGSLGTVISNKTTYRWSGPQFTNDGFKREFKLVYDSTLLHELIYFIDPWIPDLPSNFDIPKSEDNIFLKAKPFCRKSLSNSESCKSNLASPTKQTRNLSLKSSLMSTLNPKNAFALFWLNEFDNFYEFSFDHILDNFYNNSNLNKDINFIQYAIFLREMRNGLISVRTYIHDGAWSISYNGVIPTGLVVNKSNLKTIITEAIIGLSSIQNLSDYQSYNEHSQRKNFIKKFLKKYSTDIQVSNNLSNHV